MRVSVDMSDNDLLDHYFPPDKIEDVVDLNEEVVAELTTRDDTRWQPKKWRLEYEKVVMYDMMGLKGYEIAEKMGYTPQHVYNILGCDEAIAIQRALIAKVREERGIDITGTINEIQELTVKRLRECLKDDDIFKTSRLGLIGKGIEVMKGTGEHLKAAPTTQINNQFTLPPSIADRFLAGLEKSDQVRLMLSEKNEIKKNGTDG